MNITLIVAMERNRGIGYQNTIPWMRKIPSDMKHFRETTTGHPIIMGRNTYDSIGQALPNRTNIVLTRSLEFHPINVHVFTSLSEAMAFATQAPGGEEIFITGGAQVYKEALPYANKIILTKINGEFTVDTYFPEIDQEEWSVSADRFIASGEKDQFDLNFITLERIAT